MTEATTQKPPMFQISVDTQLIVDRLEKANVGDRITYQEMGKIIQRDVQNEARCILDSARRILMNQKRVVFETVRMEGIKRLADNELVHTGENTRTQIRRITRRGLKKLACVQNFDGLTNVEKIKHNTEASVLGMLHQMSKPKTAARIESRVAEKDNKVSMKEALTLLGANGSE